MFNRTNKETNSNVIAIEPASEAPQEACDEVKPVKRVRGRPKGSGSTGRPRKLLGSKNPILDKRRYRSLTMSELVSAKTMCEEMINKKKHDHIVALERQKSALDKELQELQESS